VAGNAHHLRDRPGQLAAGLTWPGVEPNHGRPGGLSGARPRVGEPTGGMWANRGGDVDRGRTGPGRPWVAGGAPIRPARPRASPEGLARAGVSGLGRCLSGGPATANVRRRAGQEGHQGLVTGHGGTVATRPFPEFLGQGLSLGPAAPDKALVDGGGGSGPSGDFGPQTRRTGWSGTCPMQPPGWLPYSTSVPDALGPEKPTTRTHLRVHDVDSR
jgi:hypothetical protein